MGTRAWQNPDVGLAVEKPVVVRPQPGGEVAVLALVIGILESGSPGSDRVHRASLLTPMQGMEWAFRGLDVGWPGFLVFCAC